ncbi:MAG: bifunctional glutamate N-acetyltransferase/amino-acid acetyltransferase ArgJ [Gemmataceae bacterium]
MNIADLPLAVGYRYSGIVSGLRNEPNRRDLAIIESLRPATAAGVYTQNRVCAAPVQLSRRRTPSNTVRAIVICSGNANACTGPQGDRDAERMTELVAEQLGCTAPQVLVASTGVIGRLLPMPILEAGIPRAVTQLAEGPAALADAAHAILTTDTRIKLAGRKVGPHTITGFAKGAAMIGPNMATMLGVIVSDATLPVDAMNVMLRRAVDPSFNCISVEGHMSTNDTVFLMGNGATGPLAGPAELYLFAKALEEVCADLAQQIAEDAEGAQHLITIHVEGCESDAAARTIAKTVAESALVKTAIYGADPNWGRIVSAAGYAGVPFEERELSLTLGTFLLYEAGRPLPFDAAAVSQYIKTNRSITMTLRLTHGTGRCRFYTSDLTPEYVALNADYTT